MRTSSVTPGLEISYATLVIGSVQVLAPLDIFGPNIVPSTIIRYSSGIPTFSIKFQTGSCLNKLLTVSFIPGIRLPLFTSPVLE